MVYLFTQMYTKYGMSNVRWKGEELTKECRCVSRHPLSHIQHLAFLTIFDRNGLERVARRSLESSSVRTITVMSPTNHK